MKGSVIGIITIFVVVGALLLTIAPDTLSLIVVLLMCVVIAAGLIIAILPSVMYASGLKNARNMITETLEVNTEETWIAVFKNESIFRHKKLDAFFKSYRRRAEEQKENDEIISDIEDYISEDLLYVQTWQGLSSQIPGTLTGLGIFGTFIGLITGISSIGFSSVEAALESVSTLLNGIRLAFYTSIAGVILSIIFNIVNKIVWNVLTREHVYFVDSFHKEVIPSSGEQARYMEQKNMRKIISRLDRLPKNDDFSVAAQGGSQRVTPEREQTLMPQIMSGISRGEFTFYLQPKLDLSDKKIIAAKALVRWEHETLGTLSPSSFIPLLEQNGYIVRLDSYIWERVFSQMRIWIDEGRRPVPVVIHVSKTDILAMDVVLFLQNLLEKYKVPPRSVEIEVAKNAFVQNPSLTGECTGALRRLGFKVIMGGFDGDYISVNMLENTDIDTVDLDMRYVQNAGETVIAEIFERARKLKVEMTASCIENAQQHSLLMRNGCRTGHGYYFHKPMSIDKYESVTGRE